MVLAVVFVLGAGMAAGWAISFERSAYRAVHRPDAGNTVAPELSTASSRPSRADAGVGAVGGETGPASTSVGQLEATPPRVPAAPVSVLGWESFVVLSVLFLDGTVLLGCRNLGPARSPKSSGFNDSDQTIVLRLGDDHRAAAALGVFEDWRKRRSPLRLRPIEVPGAIEILDRGYTRIRAPLASA